MWVFSNAQMLEQNKISVLKIQTVNSPGKDTMIKALFIQKHLQERCL
jgi:hypothetical protein